MLEPSRLEASYQSASLPVFVPLVKPYLYFSGSKFARYCPC